jgi:DNA-directed RNA polymerase subunit RPC12/RpoP
VHNELRSELDNAAPPVYVVQSDICHKCDTVMIILASDALLGCPRCSYTRLYIQATSSRITYGEEVEFANFSYKRINHFQEWLNTFQAKESTEVPEPIITAVMEQLFVAKKVRDVAGITQKVVRETLKDLKLRKYYDHTPQITARITGVLPPRMTPFQAEQVKLMFSAIQGPFNIHCPPERTNFLSYGYCLFKFCELMGYDEFLPCFTLLKGQDKLSAMDRIWEKICFELDWQFISSV